MYLNSTNQACVKQSGSCEKGVAVKSTPQLSIRIPFLFLVIIMKTLLILVELLTVTV